MPTPKPPVPFLVQRCTTCGQQDPYLGAVHGCSACAAICERVKPAPDAQVRIAAPLVKK